MINELKEKLKTFSLFKKYLGTNKYWLEVEIENYILEIDFDLARQKVDFKVWHELDDNKPIFLTEQQASEINEVLLLELQSYLNTTSSPQIDNYDSVGHKLGDFI